MPERDVVAITIYLPRVLHEWLGVRKARGHGALTRQITRYCEEGRIRDELAEALEAVRPDLPAALERIRGRVEQQKRPGQGPQEAG